MKKFKKMLLPLLAATGLIISACSNPATKTNSPATQPSSELKKVDFLLDWTPNTNHTGLYVAKEKGYLKEVGIDLDIKTPAEESTSDLIINNKAPMGIYFQDFLANKLSKGAEVTAVAAIIENNTSGIISNKASNIVSPKDLANKKYGTWEDPVELAMIKTIMENENADFSKIKKVPNTDSNSIIPMVNNVFESAWVYQAWDGIMAKYEKLDTNFFFLKDYAAELNFYSPIIIANNDYLKSNPEEAKKIVQAIKKGYQYAIANPEEAADILIKYSPELGQKKDFVIESQKYISKEYASNPSKWGEIDAKRWDGFYKWAYDNKVIEKEIAAGHGFTNDLVK
ncbi:MULTISPECIES: ABC transporter substrate-binding protein [unclassified Gemella]|uniref:ABC transporter substrate-binding protein n=1 Tax=unclassified Gemella TaxID=2624949 RepID=UPI00107353E3|nr:MULTISPECIES: ABC transporter substrate-binding protein [unclassified Gemella]MBF0710501.1 ABC transporter substrate-binding protein [Gemella sp. GL1.1]MBF0746558.1 ABC transporter substrate-binding protein [Gemella sp. 19428wG2_WT2a]NYS27845.1 ABC transporter substrate-binding protein [Gemella sp. GL1]TFU59918.1 ABC transporter substrate-binding protein [Gemella sp. WT2a]